MLFATGAQAQNDVVFLIDGSSSIDTADFELERQGLSAALQSDAILPRDGSVGLAVVQFAGVQAQVEVPFTRINTESDVTGVLARLAAMSQLGGSTNPGDGVNLANAILNNSGDPAADQNICLATDGIPNEGADLPSALDAARASAIGLDRFGVVAVEDPPFLFEDDFQATYGPLVFGGATVTVVRNAAEFANTIGTACFPIPLDLVGLEVNQAIQDWVNSVPLITGKTTYVRAHVESSSGQPVVAVARLRGFRGGSELPGSPLVPINPGGSISAPVDAAAVRDELNSSLNFRLPPSWRNGTVTLTVEGVGSELTCLEAAGTPQDCSVEASFTDAESPEMRYYRVRYSQNGNVFQPSVEDIGELIKRQLAISPIADLFPEIDTLDWAGPVPPNRTLLNLTLRARRLLEGCFSTLGCDRLDYGAMLAAGDLGGRALGIPGTVSSGSIPSGPFEYGRNRHVHEAGHSLGLAHAPFCGARVGLFTTPLPYDTAMIGGEEVATLGPMNQGEDRLIYGYDGNAVQVVDPNETFELMSYCGRKANLWRWISHVSYDAMLAAINERFDSNSAAAEQLGPAMDHLLIRGMIDLVDDEASFLPFGLLPSSMTPDGPASGDYTLRLLDDAGQLREEIAFAPTEIHADAGVGTDGEDPGLGELLIAVPYDAAIRRAEILHGANLLTALDASPSPPTVEVLSPNGGESLGDEKVEIRWQADDADGDPLTYTVQHSADGGTTWKTLVIDWTATSYEIEREALAGSPDAMIRVMASDGFHTAIDTSDGPIEVANNPPQIVLLSPRTGDSFVGVQLLFLEALAWDREDGGLDETQLSWSSSLDGDLGNGRELVLVASDLTQGEHEIRVTATDQDGSESSKTAIVTVGRIGNPPCVEGPTTLCLNNKRFRVELDWNDSAGQSGAGQTVGLRSDDSGLMWFFDGDSWEILVKVLDGCDYNGHFWAFAAAPTELGYNLRITDTVSGSTTEYINPVGNVSPAFTDTRAFTSCTPGSSPVHRVIYLDDPDFAGQEMVSERYRDLSRKNGCVPSASQLCLQQDRFAVSISWSDFFGNSGTGTPVPGGTDTSGLFWFFNAENWETLIRVVDGCDANGHYWVFAAAPTNVEYTLQVTDTVSGEVVEYHNPLGESARPVLDTAAFGSCP